MKVGVIGLGQIGGGVAQCLSLTGTLAAIYDVFPDVAEKLNVGVANSSSPRAVAEQSDVVLVAVFSYQQARDVLTGDQGLLAAGRKEVPIVLLSTISTGEYEELRTLANQGGIDLLDCGVTGGSTAATGGLVCLIGGSEEAVERVRPALDGFAKGVYRMGGPGSGMAGKIARNVMIYGTWLVEYEAFKLAKAAGVDARQLISVVLDSRDSVALPCAWPRRDPEIGLEEADGIRRERSASLLAKDLTAALDLAEKHGVTMPTAQLALDSGRLVTGLETEADR